jgi:integrase
VARPKNDHCGVCGQKAHPDGIRHLPSKRYQARFLGPDGRSHSRTFQTTRDAKAWLSAQHSDISRGTWEEKDTLVVVTFGDYAKRWLANRKVKGRPLADRTREGYTDLLNRFILPTFGARPIHLIYREEVEKWYDHTAVNSPTYRARAYALLRSILASAMDGGYLAVNPARIRGAGQASRRHRVRPASFEELDALTSSMPPRYRLLVQLAAFCALRFGELTELRRGDIDTQRGVIMVRRAVVLVNGGFVIKKPKSEAGVRDVNIPPHLLPMVREHLLAHTAPGPDGLLFPSKNDPNQHMRQSALTRVYYPARRAAGRPDLRFHDLRHTGAVLAAQTGATLAELMGRLGHSTSQAALRYQHAAADRDAVIAAKLSALAEAHMISPRGG